MTEKATSASTGPCRNNLDWPSRPNRGSTCFDGKPLLRPRYLSRRGSTIFDLTVSYALPSFSCSLIEEQMEDPSGWFIVAIFFSVITLFMGYKSLKQLGDPFSAGQLSLEDVRRLQQERYARGELEYEEETDSSSDEEPGLMGQLIFQRVPRQPSAPEVRESATPSEAQ